jgi:putative ABC transport system ATP-binding protein
MATPLVDVRNLSKSYYRDQVEIVVLRNLSLRIQQGEFFGLIGPSGSGKTTLLNMVAGIDRPDEGEVRVGDTDIVKLDESELAKWRSHHIGFIFQFYNLLPVLTAFENVELPLLLSPLGKKERAEHVKTALGVVGLGDRMDHYPRQLSGGQEQRVAIARAIVTDPVLLLADEPTGDLDRQSAENILDLLGRLNREFHKTIIMVTHDPRAVERTTSHLSLDKGELQKDAVHVGA